ncbi:GWxTD domain-containing protein [Rhodohalobacter sp.]|uniref:GWxTD domain-containing protein n=1 Tax=Rhodohalobacter sp. TaxID=1974210 RepID=UPI00356850EA
MHRITGFLIAILLFSVADINAQRQNSYKSLLRQIDQPSAFSDHVVLPQNDSTSVAAVLFRMEHDFLPFLKKRSNMDAPADDLEYFAPVRIGLEVFEGEPRKSRRQSTPSGVSVFRDMWSDTVWVSTFEDTRSRFDHTQGVLSGSLSPGEYHYQIQLARGGSERELPSQVRPITVANPSELEKADFMITNSLEMSGNAISAVMLNYGQNVLYGQDYTVLIRLPSAEADDLEERYELSVQRSQDGEAISSAEPHFKKMIGSESLFLASESSISKQGEKISLQFQTGENGFRYAFVNIPNVEFENAEYKIELKDLTQDQVVGEKTIQSRWIDMPVSLYNLDIAIEMLKFIVSDRELRNLSSGSKTEQERKFREFWAERDPTPDTEYNELMAEYYQRIDYAYQNFSSLQVPGYESDRGRAYILYGPPDNIDRRLLPNQPTREIWEYPNRELIFEATSGLGDFKLVSES